MTLEDISEEDRRRIMSLDYSRYAGIVLPKVNVHEVIDAVSQQKTLSLSCYMAGRDNFSEDTRGAIFTGFYVSPQTLKLQRLTAFELHGTGAFRFLGGIIDSNDQIQCVEVSSESDCMAVIKVLT